MRLWLVLAFACGGSSKSAEPPRPTPAPAEPAADGCAAAYEEYEARWTTARSEELAEAEFDPDAIADVVRTETARLPTESELATLQGQYAAMALFLPGSPWPIALEAAEAAIAVCGEQAPRPAG